MSTGERPTSEEMTVDRLGPMRTRRAAELDDVAPALLDAVADAVDAAVIVVDTTGTVRMWNDAAERIYGWSAAEAIGEQVADLIVPVSQRAENDRILTGLRNGDGWRGRFTCRRRDGSLVPVQVTDTPVLDADGRIRAVVGISRDLTERLDADRDHRSLQALADTTGGAVLTVTSGRISAWSVGAERLLGWSAAEAIGSEIWKIVPDSRHDEAMDLLDRITMGEPVSGLRTARLSRDGTEVPVVLDISPVYDAGTQRWVGIVNMVDARQRDEVIEAALAAELRSKYLLAQSNETIFVFGRDGRMRSASASVRSVLGYEPADLLSGAATIAVHPDDEADVTAAFMRALLGSEEHPTATYRRQTAAGDWRWAETTFTNRLDDPVVRGIVANARDVTEREAAQATAVEREARWSAVMNRSSDVAMFFDRDGVIGWVSPAITEALGLTPESMVGTNAADFVHPDDREPTLAAFRSGLRRTGDHIRVEFRFIGAGGDVRWVEEVATDLVDDPHVGFIVANLRDVTDRKRATDQLARMALVDDLTDLPNRNALCGRMEDALRRERTCAVLFFGLDDFSDVNDALGHHAGDELLVGVARRVGAALPAGALLARFGGDQFAVLLEVDDDHGDTGDGREATPDATTVGLALAASVQAALAAPFVVDGKEVFAVASVGIAVSPPGDVDALLRRADVALNRAKHAGRGRAVVFEREQGAESRRRLHYAGELRRAIARREIVPHYQPVVDLATGRVVAVEALARWDHPVLGRVPPDIFVPVAESTGLVADLGDQILDRSCADAISWLALGLRLQVAVNASALEVTDPAFPAQVAATLHHHGLPADRLTIEVTETAALRDVTTASATLGALRDLGVNLSLDDFGTGYSSLSFLKRLPVAALKVDRSFVSGLGRSSEDDQIVTGVVGLALALGLVVVGEGIESPEQARRLAEMGCGFAQGYLWSPAVPAAELPAVIARIEGS